MFNHNDNNVLGSFDEERGASRNPSDGCRDVGLHDRGERGVATDRGHLQSLGADDGILPLVGAGHFFSHIKVSLQQQQKFLLCSYYATHLYTERHSLSGGKLFYICRFVKHRA